MKQFRQLYLGCFKVDKFVVYFISFFVCVESLIFAQHFITNNVS